MPQNSLENFNKSAEIRKAEQEKNVDILLKKLETGVSCDIFDGSTIKLLDEVLWDAKKKSILELKVFRSVAEWIASKMAGVGVGVLAMEEGSKYASEIAKGYLREKMLLEIGSNKTSIPKEVTETIVSTGDQTNFLLAMREAASSLVSTANAALTQVKEKVQDVGTTAVNYVSETFINNIAGPTTEMLSKPPLAVGGFLLGAGVVGGGISVVRAMRERSGFEPIAKMIQKSDEFIENGRTSEDGRDPRLELIAYFENISEDPKHIGHKLSQEEWLMLAGAVRMARASILRDMTHAPRIVAEAQAEEAMSRQERIVEDIIQNQQDLAEADMKLATEILAQFGEHLGKDLDPIKQKFKYNDTFLPKIGAYSKAFIRGGFDATGIPMAWRMVVFGLSSAHNIATGGTILKVAKKYT